MSRLTRFVRSFRQRHFPDATLRRALAKAAGASVRVGDHEGSWNFARLNRRARDRELLVGVAGVPDPQERVRWLLARAPVLAHLLGHSTLPSWSVTATLSDGDEDGDPDHITPCSSRVNALLIPDPDYYNSRGHARWRPHLKKQRPWRERSSTITWRGATTGIGRLPASPSEATAAEILPRVILCARLAGQPGVDAKISTVCQTSEVEPAKAVLGAAGALGGSMPQEAWLDHRFAIDIDGNTNAWSNLFTRLLFGCCVIKVASPHGFRQWYYDRLEPMRHYVPVRADLADLEAQIAWCRDNTAECERIAAEGQALALSMTFDREMADAVGRVDERMRQRAVAGAAA